jgi:hypothetical protein
VWACFLALSSPALLLKPAAATGNNFETAKAIGLNQRYEGSLPVSQGRHCYRVDVPNGKKVAIKSSNNYGSVFVSAYTGHGNLMIGETQILSSYQPDAFLQTEETDGSVMVCIDSDMAQRQRDHHYSLEVSILGNTAVAKKPTVKLPSAVAIQPAAKPATVVAAKPAVTPVPVEKKPLWPTTFKFAASMREVSATPEQITLPVIVAKQTYNQPPLVAKKPTKIATPKKVVQTVAKQRISQVSATNPLVVVSQAPDFMSYPQTKTRKSEERESSVSSFISSPLLLAANSRSFDRDRDAYLTGDSGGNFGTARYVVPNQMYGGFLNAKGSDARDCYIYSGLPKGSRLKVAFANNDGILGASAYSDKGSILIGQSYIVNQQGSLKTEATSGDVMVCLDTDGEKSDHQYTFSARVDQ